VPEALALEYTEKFQNQGYYEFADLLEAPPTDKQLKKDLNISMTKYRNLIGNELIKLKSVNTLQSGIFLSSPLLSSPYFQVPPRKSLHRR
jgi:hypothetical protein